MATEADLIQKFKDLNIPVGSDFEELIHEAFVGANLVDKVENHDSRISTVENNLDAAKGSIQAKVTDNHDGTEQLNGVKVQPFNKLSDTIGGRNLLINTAQLNDSTVCLAQESNISDTYLGLNIYQTNAPWKGVKVYWSYLVPKLKTNTDYVMSEYVRNTSPTTSVDIGIYGNNTGVVFNSGINYFVATLPPNSEWIRISALVNIDSFPATIRGVLRFENTTILTDGYVQFAGLKFEKGSIATDWTPAPEDKADDSKAVHNSGNEEIAGQKTFDTAPIDKTTGNPYITKDGVPAVPSTLADTTKDANFTGKLQKSGIDVATKSDVTTAVSAATANMADDSKVVHRSPDTGIATDATDFPYNDLKVDGYPVIPFVLVPDRKTALAKTAQYPNYAFMYGKELN